MKIKIAIFIGVAIAIPLVLDCFIFSNAIPSHISNEAWAGFLGSYIGGLCTMGALFITISDNNKKIESQKKELDEEKRLKIRPYLDTRYTYFDYAVSIGANDRIFDIENEHTKMVHFDISETRRRELKYQDEMELSRILLIDYSIRNVGAGSAVDMTVKVNNFEEKIAIAKDECVHLFCIVNIHNVENADLKISLFYCDIENRAQYTKEDIIRIEIDEDERIVSRPIKFEQQKFA